MKGLWFGRPRIYLHIERVDDKMGRTRTAGSGKTEDWEPGMWDYGLGATHPLTSKLLRSSGSAVAAGVAMSSECDFWSRAMGSGCDVITAIRADCGCCKSAQRARRDMKGKRRLIGHELRGSGGVTEMRATGIVGQARCDNGAPTAVLGGRARGVSWQKWAQTAGGKCATTRTIRNQTVRVMQKKKKM